MRRREFEGMCELASEGRITWIENQDTHTMGRVLTCNESMITVQVGDHSERWDHRICQEKTHGYKVNYDEVKKHPHEFDTHLD